jgi:hypothetical protein
MESMPQDNLDLPGIFSTVTQALTSNQQSLNQADTYNQDHGDNMVQTFQTITQALQHKSSAPASDALAYAAQMLAKNTSSGSGKLYAQNLSLASNQFKGHSLDAQGAVSLLQTLIGSGQSSESGVQPGGGDVLGALLGSLGGSQDALTQQPEQSSGGDLLGTLFGGLSGGGADSSTQTPSTSGGADMLGTLLSGLAGGGGGGLASLIQTLLGGSGMGDASHRTQSTQLVINAFLQALSALNRQ